MWEHKSERTFNDVLIDIFSSAVMFCIALVFAWAYIEFHHPLLLVLVGWFLRSAAVSNNRKFI